jgi:hypothetical protein
MKRLVSLLALALLFGCSAPPQEIKSFEDCVKAGYPVMESYPRQCAVPGGKTFTSEEDLKQILAGIRTFDDCAAAGYPVMESYPRQCRTPDGRTFVSQKDAFDINLNVSCSADSDCRLVDSSLGFACCYAGACNPADYSQYNWIAVNGRWFDTGRSSYCPAESECGPAPMCLPRPINENYTAKCVESKCVKAPLAELAGCCDECIAAFSRSPVGVGAEGAKCGQFASAAPISVPCMSYFASNPTTVAQCGYPSPPSPPLPPSINLTEGACNAIFPSGAMGDKLNIVFLPSHHYSNMSKFAEDTLLFKDALFDFPFYEENSGKINMFLMAGTSGTDGCELAGGTTPYCNITAMRALASGCSFDQGRGDQLVVIFDNDAVSTPYARGEGPDDILFIGSGASSIFVHEFSHSFGDLGDTYDGSWNNTVDPEYPNCASMSPGYTCEDKWGGLMGYGSGDQLVGCYQNCHAENWYRPTLGGDVMRDSSKTFYDPVSLQHMLGLMNMYH